MEDISAHSEQQENHHIYIGCDVFLFAQALEISQEKSHNI